MAAGTVAPPPIAMPPVPLACAAAPSAMPLSALTPDPVPIATAPPPAAPIVLLVPIATEALAPASLVALLPNAIELMSPALAAGWSVSPSPEMRLPPIAMPAGAVSVTPSARA